jgi:hypothetical protein
VDDISNALAVLGVYFALVAALSVAVEAVVGWFKLPFPSLQGKPSPSDAINEIKAWLPTGNAYEDKQQLTLARITALNKALAALGEERLSARSSPAKIAETVGEATTKYVKLERHRRAIIRAMTILVGIGFAAFLRLDTVALLGPLIDPAINSWRDRLGPDTLHIIGLVLSGVSASAGSSFWHDQSARLRYLKSAAQALNQAEQPPDF